MVSDPTERSGPIGAAPPSQEPAPARPAECPSCGAPDNKPPAGPCADTYHGPTIAPSAGVADAGGRRVITKYDLGGLTFSEYRKKALTPISANQVPRGTIVHTSSTETTEVEEPSRIALDAEGHPYPIREAIFRDGFEPVDGAAPPEEVAYIVNLTAGDTAQVALWAYRHRCGFDGVKVMASGPTQAIAKARAENGPEDAAPEDTCPTCGALWGFPPAGPCEDPFHNRPRPPMQTESDKDKMLPPGMYAFHAEQVEEALLQAAGAASGVFLRADPGMVMPTTQIEEAVREWAVGSVQIFGPASQRALGLGGASEEDLEATLTAARLTDAAGAVKQANLEAADVFGALTKTFTMRMVTARTPDERAIWKLAADEVTELFEKWKPLDWGEQAIAAGFPPNPPKTIILMRDRSEFDQRVIQDASLVIDKDGIVIKNRDGVGGIAAGDNLLEKAVPVFPHSEAERAGSIFPMPKMDPSLREGSTPRREAAGDYEVEFSEVPGTGLALGVSVAALILSILALVAAV